MLALAHRVAKKAARLMLESAPHRATIMSSENGLVFLSVTRQAQLIRESALSPLELVAAYLRRELGRDMERTEPVPPVYPREPF